MPVLAVILMLCGCTPTEVARQDDWCAGFPEAYSRSAAAVERRALNFTEGVDALDPSDRAGTLKHLDRIERDRVELVFVLHILQHELSRYEKDCIGGPPIP